MSLNDNNSIFWVINIQVVNIHIASYFLWKDMYACLDYQLLQLLTMSNESFSVYCKISYPLRMS